MNRVLRSPVAHFLLLGSLLFAAQRGLAPADRSIALSTAETEQLRQNWQRTTGRAPTAAEFRAAVQARVDEEILLQEALAQGLDERDSVARERLLRNLRFAFPDHPADDASLLREARRLGMNRRDRVVRQRLIERMRQKLGQGASLSEAEVRDYIARHGERYGQPVRYAFRQYFFSRDQRGAQLEGSANGALAQLRAGRSAAGDPFLLGERFTAATQTDIARNFGATFASDIASAPVRQWSGPYESPYGLHLVWIDERLEAQPADAQALRAQAAYAALTEREHAAVQQALVALRQRYRVDIGGRS